jgi:methyl-accepting chemotaxis protein
MLSIKNAMIGIVVLFVASVFGQVMLSLQSGGWAWLFTALTGGATVIALWYIVQIIKPMDELSTVMQAKANGFLVDVPHCDKQNEIGVMARSLSTILANSKPTQPIVSVASTGDVSKAKEEANYNCLKVGANMIVGINDIALDMAFLVRNTRSLNNSAQTIASATTQLASSVENITDNSESASSNATAADGTVGQGRDAVGRVKAAIDNIATAVDQTAASVDELAEASDQIGQILDVIEDIAHQTNLLALNATIEAARAGESGKGFAVVAAEVKGLANQTSKSTDDISRRIAALRGGMSTIRTTMGQSKAAVGDGEAAILDASNVMEEIAGQVGDVAHRMQDISRILRQQQEATHEIAHNVDYVARSATENEARLVSASEILHKTNEDFLKRAQTFQVEGDPRSLCQTVKIDHIIFKKRIIDTITGHDHWHAAEVPDHHTCRLGEWYDKRADASIRQLPAFVNMLKPHERVHAVGREVLVAHEQGNAELVMESLSKLHDASADVIVSLDEFIQELEQDQGKNAGTPKKAAA